MAGLPMRAFAMACRMWRRSAVTLPSPVPGLGIRHAFLRRTHHSLAAFRIVTANNNPAPNGDTAHSRVYAE